jgi:CBS domain-containing protein
MALVKDIMTAEVVTVTPGTAVTQAARLMLELGFNALPVVDDHGGLVGIISQSDLIGLQKDLRVPSYFTLLDGLIPLASPRHFEKELERVTAANVGQAMTPQPVTVTPAATVGEAAALMVERNYHTLPVVEGGRLVGVLGKEDVLRTLLS